LINPGDHLRTISDVLLSITGELREMAADIQELTKRGRRAFETKNEDHIQAFNKYLEYLSDKWEGRMKF